MRDRCPVCRNHLLAHLGKCPACAFRTDQPFTKQHVAIWITRWLGAVIAAVWVTMAVLSLWVGYSFVCFTLLLVSLLMILHGHAAERAESRRGRLSAASNGIALVVTMLLPALIAPPGVSGWRRWLAVIVPILIAAISLAAAARVWLKPLGTTLHPLQCVQCGYTLYGLGIKGVCPECGTAFDRSEAF